MNTSLLAWSISPNWHSPSPFGQQGVRHAQVIHPLRLEVEIREQVSGPWQFLTQRSHTPEPLWHVYTIIRLPWLMLKPEAFFFFFECCWDVAGAAMPLCLGSHGFWATSICLCSFFCFLSSMWKYHFCYGGRLGGGLTCYLHHLLDSHSELSPPLYNKANTKTYLDWSKRLK